MSRGMGVAALMIALLVGYGSWMQSVRVVEGLPANKTAYALLPQINAEGPYLGLIIPNPFELAPFLQPDVFVAHPTVPYLDLAGRRFYVGTIEGHKIIAVMTGLAMLNAGITTQQLLDFFDISGVVHYGVAGGSDNSLHIGDVSVPKLWLHSGLWVWQRYGDDKNSPLPLEAVGDYSRAFGALKFGKYNIPQKQQENGLNRVWFQEEEVFPVTGTPEVRQRIFYVPVDNYYLNLSKQLESLKLESCFNGTCLDKNPVVKVGLIGAAANVFVDNADFRTFLYNNYKVSSIDMESSAIALTCYSNNVPFIVFRSLSDLAGGSAEPNQFSTFVSLAAINAVTVVRSFIKLLGSSRS